MGEILRSEVDKMDANRELQTQLRYAQKVSHASRITHTGLHAHSVGGRCIHGPALENPAHPVQGIR